MTSLRTRALAGGVLWGLITIVLGLVGLASYLNSQSDARFDALLQTRHTQALVAVANNATFPDSLGRAIGDPIYQRPFSGQYWQIQSADGQLFVSPSLVDTLLPQADPAQTDLVRRDVAGPADDLVLSISQWLTLDDGSRWHVQVASSYDALDQETALLRRSLFSAFGIVSIIGLIGALALVRAVLRPLDALRAEVAARWEHKDGLDPQDYPIEVAPLVTDINSLLERNRETLRSSRRQAADLAHAIKTPSAIMRNELSRLQSEGLAVGDAVEALDRLDAQLKRSFARMRADGTDASISTFTDLDDALGRMQRAFTALARNSDRVFAADITPDLRVRMDKSDLEEVIGNLLDNALKWSRGRFEMSATLTDEPAILMCIEDDGDGIPDGDLGLATVGGQRLDSSKPGTGLGLAIASDLIHAYGGTIHLARSKKLGGLAAYVRLPVPGGPKLDMSESSLGAAPEKPA